MFTHQDKVQTENSTRIIRNQSGNTDAGRKETAFRSIFSLIGRVLSIRRQKMDERNPADVDRGYQIVYSRADIFFTRKNVYSIIGID